MPPELIITCTIFLFHSSISCCQPNPGARVTAMGKSTATATGLAATYSNPAGITSTSQPSAFLGFVISPLTPEISTQSFALLYPVGRNSLAIGIQRYGLPEFYTLSAGFIYAKKFGDQLRIAIRLNYVQVNATNYGALSGFNLDMGIMIAATSKVLLGAYINNPAQQKYISDKLNYHTPTSLGIGATWQAADQVALTAMLEKDVHVQPDFRVGMEYKPDERFILRGGASLKPAHHFAGFGFSYRHLVFDFAVSSNIHTGYQPQLDISYAW